ncbi:MAG: hypothetical protein ACSHYA_15090 [Opitutaceae bacterium]
MEYTIRIEYRSSANLSTDCDNFIQRITGRIVATSLNSEEEQEIGEIKLAYIDVVSAEDDGCGLFSLFDADSLPSTYCFTLYNLDEYGWTDLVYETFGDELFNNNLLIIHRIKLLSKFRGHKIGLLAIRRSIQQFGHGCGLVYLKAMPYQVELRKKDTIEPGDFDKYGLSKFAADQSIATQQLESHYQQAGFIKITGSDLMAINLANEFPSMKKMGASFDGIFQI